MSNGQYSVMLVDDESIFLEDMYEELIAAGGPFHVVYQCCSPQQALEAFRQQPCDVVFTDIQMPGMDGIDLAVELKRISPAVIVVFLTGYSKMEYAQRAIRCGGYDFLLKPLEKTQLLEMLRNIQDRCDADRQEKICRELNAIAVRGKGEGLIREDISLHIAAVGVGHAVGVGSHEHQERVSRSLHAAAAAIRRFFSGDENRFLWISGEIASDTVFFAFDPPMTDDDWTALFEEIRAACAPFSATLCIERKPVSGLQWGDAARRMKHNLAHDRLFCASSVIARDEAATEPADISGSMTLLSKAMREKDGKLFVRAWREIVQLFEKNAPRTDEAEQTLNLLTGMLDMHIEDVGRRRLFKSRIFWVAAEACDLGQCFNEILEIVLEAAGMEDAEPSNDAMAEQIAGYLKMNLSSDISMKDISARFAYNPSYIHRIFKKVYGRAPMKYLNDIRIELAAELLRKTPPMRIQDVSRLTGFADQYYFSRVFKQSVGKTPVEYQKEYTHQISTDENE